MIGTVQNERQLLKDLDMTDILVYLESHTNECEGLSYAKSLKNQKYVDEVVDSRKI